MKQCSIGITLKLRYASSIVYYISMMLYGVMTISIYGKEDIGLGKGIVIIMSFLLAMLCMMIKSVAVQRYADPLNKLNQRKYTVMVLTELLGLISVYTVSTLISDNKRVYGAIIYAAVLTIVTFFILGIHKRIYCEYDKLKKEKKLDELINEYKVQNNEDIEGYIKKFIYFMLYGVVLSVLYEYTLHSWLLTIVFFIVNIYVLRKLHWEGIVKFVRAKKLYFTLVCFASSIGIVFLKLAYDGYIILSVLQNRDGYEYFMIFVLFYFPIVYYGTRISSVYTRGRCQWVN